MSNTLNQIRIRVAARCAKDAIELLVADPSHPDLMQKLNDALVLLRRAFPEPKGD